MTRRKESVSGPGVPEVAFEGREHPSLDRIAGFSDAVFAIAITLLVLAIRIPLPSDANRGEGLLSLLTHEWRSLVAFALSFMLIGINWANHRIMFKILARADHTLVWLNLLYLMLAVVFMPVPTAVLGAWLGSGQNNQVVAAVFYGASATVGGITFAILWWYAAYHANLVSPRLGSQQRRAHSLAWCPAPVVAAGLTLVAFLYPALSIAGFIIVILAYVLPLPRLVLRKQQAVASAHVKGSAPSEERTPADSTPAAERRGNDGQSVD